MKRVLTALLDYWSRPRIFAHESAVLQPGQKAAVCYLLPRKSRMDFFALNWAARRVGRLPLPDSPSEIPGFTAPGTLYLEAADSPGLTELAAFCKKNPHLELRLIPVSIFWGQEPGAEKHRAKRPADRQIAAGFLRRLVCLLTAPRHSLIQFGQALSPGSLLEQAGSAERLPELLREIFYEQKLICTGPDLPQRKQLIREVQGAPEVQAAMAREARKKNLPEASVKKLVGKYVSDMSILRSRGLVRLASLLLTWLWQKLYQGIEVEGLAELKAAAAGQKLVYVPSHRSHMDYLLLSWLLYHEGMALPHIASGQNLNLFILGPILRRVGAFFMRRSFQDDFLYKTVFEEYLFRMLQRGFPIEFFLEGGRSRTGCLLSPKLGMISMLARAEVRDPDLSVLMVPVYIGYERVLEAKSYARELSGKPKKSESLLSLFGIFRVLNQPFGKVYVKFGETLALKPWLESHLGDRWREAESGQFRNCYSLLATRLAQNINQAGRAGPVNLLATALLAGLGQKLDRAALTAGIELYTLLQKQSAALPGAGSMQPDAVFQQAATVLQLRFDEEVCSDLSAAGTMVLSSLAWYRNNTLHLFVLPSLLALFVQHPEGISRSQLHAKLQLLAPLVEKDLNCRVFDLDELDRLLAVFHAKGLVRSNQDRFLPAADNPDLPGLGAIIQPLLLRSALLLTAKLFHDASESAEAFWQMAQSISRDHPRFALDLQDKRALLRLPGSLSDNPENAERLLLLKSLLPAEVQESLVQLTASEHTHPGAPSGR